MRLNPKKIFIIMFVILNIIIIYNSYLSKNIIESYFRVHIVANSNSIDDQLLKYTVAKQVDNYLSKYSPKSKEDAKAIIEENIQEILKICKQTIKESNASYDVQANIGKIYYDEKQKDNISMQAGIYDSLQIIIGDGLGENWWSLIYPYAFDNVATDTTKTDDTTHVSTHEIVSSDNINIKFGFLELISKIFN